jgi:hypothetical protein
MEEALRLLHARSTGTLSSSGINPEDIPWFLEYAVEPFYLLQQVSFLWAHYRGLVSKVPAC